LSSPTTTGGGYADLAGRDASRILATMDFSTKGSTNIDDLEEHEIKVLNEWVDKFNSKYEVVGNLISG
jgi:membrane-associated progesterone receptor component